ncbi:MAG: branched-chain amino acid aminotransferase [Planctomycetota bacterium]
MNAVVKRLISDESGFIVSAELVLIGTVAVLAMVVGLSEVSFNINNELHDIASAFGAMNQSFRANGASGHGGQSSGSNFGDQHDFCDGGSLTSVSPNGGEQ